MVVQTLHCASSPFYQAFCHGVGWVVHRQAAVSFYVDSLRLRRRRVNSVNFPSFQVLGNEWFRFDEFAYDSWLRTHGFFSIVVSRYFRCPEDRYSFVGDGRRVVIALDLPRYFSIWGWHRAVYVEGRVRELCRSQFVVPISCSVRAEVFHVCPSIPRRLVGRVEVFQGARQIYVSAAPVVLCPARVDVYV